MRVSFFLLIVMFNLSHFSLAQTGYGGPPESENTKIAREHQPGGLYNPIIEDDIPAWGAIAIDAVNFKRMGFSHSTKGLQYAKSEAIAGCERKKNAKCTVVMIYDDGMCGAVALTPKGFSPVICSAEQGSSKKATEKAALKSCNEN